MSHAAFWSCNSLQERFHVLTLIMSRVLKLLLEYLHRVKAVKLGLHDLDLLPRIPSQVLEFLVILTEHGFWDALLSFVVRVGSGSLLSLLGILNPIKQGLLHEDLTSIEDQASPTPQSGHRMHHRLLVDSLKRVRCDHSFDLLS